MYITCVFPSFFFFILFYFYFVRKTSIYAKGEKIMFEFRILVATPPRICVNMNENMFLMLLRWVLKREHSSESSLHISSIRLRCNFFISHSKLSFRFRMNVVNTLLRGGVTPLVIEIDIHFQKKNIFIPFPYFFRLILPNFMGMSMSTEQL